jgi:hypothetical protein
MRSDLLRIITRWEQSGQGEGRMDAEEESHEVSSLCSSATSMAGADNDSFQNIGCLPGRPVRALQTRAALLNGRLSFPLYFWEVADSHQLLQSLLQRLINSIAASEGFFTSVSLSSSSHSQHRKQWRRQHGDFPPEDLEVGTWSSWAVPAWTTTCAAARGSNKKRTSPWLHFPSTLNLNLDLDDKRSARLSAFFTSESRLFEEELRFLDDDYHNNGVV